MISLAAFLAPMTAALVVMTTVNAPAKEQLIDVQLMCDGDAEAPPAKVAWSVRAVRKNAEGLWEYHPERKAPAPVAGSGLEIEMKLPEGPWEIQAVTSDGNHRRVVLEVNHDLDGIMWAVTDHGEPYPAEGEPTQWYLAAKGEGAVLTGAPPMADVMKFRLESPQIFREGKAVEGLQAGPDSVIALLFEVPEGFQGSVELRSANDLKGVPLHVVDAAKLAAEARPSLPCPKEAGPYEIRVTDPQRRALLRYVVTLE